MTGFKTYEMERSAFQEEQINWPEPAEPRSVRQQIPVFVEAMEREQFISRQRAHSIFFGDKPESYYTKSYLQTLVSSSRFVLRAKGIKIVAIYHRGWIVESVLDELIESRKPHEGEI